MEVHLHRDDNWHMEYVQWNGREMKKANINELLLYIKEASAIHFKEQNALIERSKLFNGDIICRDCCGAFEYCTCNNLGIAYGSISDIQAVTTDAAMPELVDTNGEVIPHSGNESNQIYSKLFSERQNHIEQGLKEMLFSWIVEGKCNIESVYSDFISSCSKELQYLCIVARKLVEKWYLANKNSLIEMCFPIEFEGTSLGDYYSVVVREKEVRSIAKVSLCLESIIRVSLFYISYNMHLRWGIQDEIKYLLPVVGNYFI
jgi:hypothetical protein